MQQHILILGAGFGGLWSALSATRLLDIHGRTDVTVSVLAPQPELRVRPRFYEADVARAVAPLGELFEAGSLLIPVDLGPLGLGGGTTAKDQQAGEGKNT